MNTRVLKIIIITLCGILFAVTSVGVLLKKKPGKSSPEGQQSVDSGNQKPVIMVLEAKKFEGEKIVIEPETSENLELPVRIRTDNAASGGKCIEIKEGAGKPPKVGGKAECIFSVKKKAVYRLWGRRWWKDSCGNSVTLVIYGPVQSRMGNGKPADLPHIFGEDPSYNPQLGLPWKWTQGTTYTLEPGTYTLTIKNREDGIRLDQFLLVEILDTDKEYEPLDIEKVKRPETGISNED